MKLEKEDRTAEPSAETQTRIQERLDALPHRPGVYLMKGADGRVIYVGKATSLRNRVRSYFQSGKGISPKNRALVSVVADIEYIVTDSEVEALILESNLIKVHSPWYNIRLKDDKAYPYLKVTTDEAFPRVVIVRRAKPDGGRYFGPYTDSQAVRQTVKFLNKLFPIRTCDLDLTTKRDHRLCLQYYIGRCPGPCGGKGAESEYDEVIRQVCLFLEGRQERLIRELERKMSALADEFRFEEAAGLRDQIRALEKVIERQKVVSQPGDDHDVIGFARGPETACVQVFFVRDGKVIGRETFFLETRPETEDSELLTAFVQQYYGKAGVVPPEILLQGAIEDPEVAKEWLSRRRGGKVRLQVPVRGEKRRLVEMVQQNAELVLQERRARADQRVAENERGLEELRETLGLDVLPRRIEGFDISNTQGTESVASMVVLVEGEPAKDEYRRFKIRSVQGPDDFASMREVIYRRFQRGLKERAELEQLPEPNREAAKAKARFTDFPDLILIDGGKGQLGAAREALRELGLSDIATLGLAKQFEHIFVEDDPDPIVLGKNSPALYLLQRLRDEAHRFALGYHRKLRGERAIGSALDEIPGVGPRRKKQLIQHFGSVRGVQDATLEQLLEVPGMPRHVAERIYQQWHAT